MKFIKKLFQKNETLKLVPGRSVYDFFSFNFKYIPDFSYEKVCEQVSKGGNINALYRKRLDYLEYGLFDTVEVKVYGTFDQKSVSLVRYDIDNISLTQLEQLVIECYNCYGMDDSYSSRGSFDETDKIAIQRKQWAGRMWTGAHHKPGAMILLDNEKLEMVIWLKDIEKT